MRLIKRWDQSLSTGDTNALLKELALWHLSQCSPSPDREYITSCINGDRFLSLCDVSIAYEKLSVHDATHLRQVLAFFTKRDDLSGGVNCRDEALRKFREAERLCSETNDIFKKWGSGAFKFSPRVDTVLYRAQRKVATILGDVPSLESIRARFGPGATTQVKKTEACARRKLSERFCCSEDLLSVLPDCLSEMPAWVPFGDAESAQVPVDIVNGRLSFVRKTALTDRAIVVEPMLNSMFQLGIGSYIAQRLLRFGVDLRDQSRNQRLAREGSISGALATLDLSSASDTIAIELVAHLLPLDWFLFLSLFRTGTIDAEGVPTKLQKFSSMGNGFTFPLESLIFYAIAISCVGKGAQEQVSVYGDDIIVPTHGYQLLCEVLRACGFIPNAQKSFATGRFRESCGGDYLCGIDIRPCYIKTRLTGADLFRLHNFYVENVREPAPQLLILSCISDDLKIWGPRGFGDGHLIGEWAPKPHKRREGWGGFTFDTYSWKPRKKFRVYPGDAVFPVYSIYARSPLAGLPGFKETSFLRINARYGRHDVVNGASESIGSEQLLRKGIPGDSLPGTSGYHRIKIYTFQTR